MFLHIGSDISVPLRDIIAILDLEASNAPPTRDFLGLARNAGHLRPVTDQPPKSYIITGQEVFLSPISSLTLLKRALKPGTGE
ncbi:MAG: DUF370 domain-containing protein [Firmicutes bacterium]|nr:DUF370 domain-containing protein [Bacillota bacterium]MCL5039137.1 DUF370 domain-containing protein [Bacillota bacterium]